MIALNAQFGANTPPHEPASNGDLSHSADALRSVGTLVTIRSHVGKVGRSSITYMHELTATLDSTLHAQARVTTVRFDLAARCKLGLEADVRERAERLLLAG